MKKLLFVFNPRSGKEQIKGKLMKILDIFIKAGYEVTVHVTQRVQDAKLVTAERAKGVDLLVCSGGDGTLNEVVSGLMTLDVKPVLGYIPAGSTNDFAASIGISKNMIKAAETAIFAKGFKTDVGRFCGDKYFVYVAAFGAFTEVSYMTPQDSKNLLGHQAYMLEAIKRLSGLKSYRLKVSFQGRELEDEFILGMVTNTISVGGFKGLVSKNVALDDGEFEVLLVRTPKAPKDFTNIITYLLMREGENESVYTFKTKALTISSQEVIDWSLDGEYGGSVTEAYVENMHRAVEIRCDRDGE